MKTQIQIIDDTVLVQVSGAAATIVQDGTSHVFYDDGVYVNGKRVPGVSTPGAQATIVATNNSRAYVTQRILFKVG
jgi:hypothetical protein